MVNGESIKDSHIHSLILSGENGGDVSTRRFLTYFNSTSLPPSLTRGEMVALGKKLKVGGQLAEGETVGTITQQFLLGNLERLYGHFERYRKLLKESRLSDDALVLAIDKGFQLALAKWKPDQKPLFTSHLGRLIENTVARALVATLPAAAPGIVRRAHDYIHLKRELRNIEEYSYVDKSEGNWQEQTVARQLHGELIDLDESAGFAGALPRKSRTKFVRTYESQPQRIRELWDLFEGRIDVVRRFAGR